MMAGTEIASISPANGNAKTVGISLEVLRALAELVKQQQGGTDWATWQVCEYFIKPMTLDKQMSYADLYRHANPDTDGVGEADVFISHAWAGNFVGLVETASGMVGKLGMDTSTTRLYVCMLCVCQHYQSTIPFHELESEFAQQLGGCTTGTVLCIAEPWNAPVYLTRSWCIFELLQVIKARSTSAAKVKYYICMSPSEQKLFVDALINDFDTIMASLCILDVANAEATVAADKENITKAIVETVGIAQCNIVVGEGIRAAVMRMAEDGLQTMRGVVDSEQCCLGC